MVDVNMTDVKVEVQAEVKVEEKVEVKVETKVEAKAEVKVENKQKYSTQTHKVVSSGEKSEELKKILEELNLPDKNNVDIPKVENKITSFGNRIRIVNLIKPDAEKWIGKTIIIAGWVRTIRVQGGGSFCFIELTDGSSVKGIQIVVDKSTTEFEFLTAQSIGASLSIKGLIIKSPGKGQLIEMQVNNTSEHYVKVVGTCNPGEYKLFKGKEQIKLDV